MCGIAGIANFDREKPSDFFKLKLMNDAILHRGPDDEGYYIHENIGIAFRRLSIIDLYTGHQPLANEDEKVWIVFNGEIYNYLELRQNLLKQGHIFRTKSDTETIIHLYEQYGTDCLQYLQGMFAFAIWDNKKQQLFCARDRFGIKPFYYYTDNEKFVFGSEIKAILRGGDIDKSLSHEALDSYFAFGYITSDLSIYKKIKKLQPGHYLLLSFKDKLSIEIKKYWEIQFTPDYSKTDNQWAEEIETCLAETVKLHMISDVPLGAFLSGGIDSSSVVGMMAKNSNTPIKTFSIGFKEQKYNELKFAREVAEKYGCEHHEQIIVPESISLLPRLVHTYDEPYADTSAIPTYYVSRLAREHVTVALTGDGGDELFAGYDHYAIFKKINSFLFNFKSAHLNKLIWGNIHKIIPRSVKGKGLIYFLSQNKNYLSAYLYVWTKEERSKLMLNNHPVINYARASELYKERILKENNNHDFITNQQYLDIQTYLVDDILTKVDRASMMNSLEVRVPLLDHKFAELSFKIPWHLKLRGKVQKYIFKRSMTPFLPENVLKHHKQGFSVPLSIWFKDNLRAYVHDIFNSNACLLYNYLDKRYIKKTISENLSGSRDFSGKIWSLLVFDEWLKHNNSDGYTS